MSATTRVKVAIANFGRPVASNVDFHAAWARYVPPAPPRARWRLFEQPVDWGFHLQALGVYLLDHGLADAVEFWDFGAGRAVEYQGNGILRVLFHDERDVAAYVNRLGPPDLFVNHGPRGQGVLDLLQGRSFRVHVPALRLGRDRTANVGAECHLVDSAEMLDARSMLYVPVVHTHGIRPGDGQKRRDFLYLAANYEGKRHDLLLNAVRGTTLTGHLHPVDRAALDLRDTCVSTSDWNEASVIELLHTSRIAVYAGDETSSPAAMWECVAAGLPIVVNRAIRGGTHLVVSGVTGELADEAEFLDVMRHVLAHRESYRPREYFLEHWDTITVLEQYLAFFRRMGWRERRGRERRHTSRAREVRPVRAAGTLRAGMIAMPSVKHLLQRGMRALRQAGHAAALEWGPAMRVVSHHAPPEFLPRFLAAGWRANHFFPHRVHRVPKCGPDGARLAERMCGVGDIESCWQIVLFALSPATDEFPPSLFFDPDLVWHGQHFGLPGQIASVNLAVHGDTLFTMVHQSDLVQRISRRREHKTRVESVFKGWHHLLLNAVLGFAVDRGLRTIRVPTAAFAMRHTDPARRVGSELFERVYDRAVQHRFRATRAGDWWTIDVAENRAALVPLERREEERATGRTICVCHDIERGLGHRATDEDFARRAEEWSDAALDTMLEVERAAGVRATYDVVGLLMNELRGRIEPDGHALAFHSYDHVMGTAQLARCRLVDYRIRGYRAPQSVLAPELRDQSLCWQNFEWFASSAASLGMRLPSLRARLARLPVHFDDYGLHRGELTWDAWRTAALDMARQEPYVTFGLHDCYAPHWLPRYRALLDELAGLDGVRLRTLDDVANDLCLAAGV